MKCEVCGRPIAKPIICKSCGSTICEQCDTICDECSTEVCCGCASFHDGCTLCPDCEDERQV